MSNDHYLDPRVAGSYDEDTDPRYEPAVRDDIPFYLGLALEAKAAGKSVLELACGTGRVTIPIAEAGVDIVGLDSSPAMLEVARHKSQGIANLRWVQGDMAGFAIEGAYGLIIIPWRSFLLLLTTESQVSCLSAIYQHLLPGGRLALNFFNPDPSLISLWLTTNRGIWEREDSYDRQRERWVTRAFDTARQQMDEQRQ
jgi:SAM-dependent methyltransferase